MIQEYLNFTSVYCLLIALLWLPDSLPSSFNYFSHQKCENEINPQT